MRRCILAVAVLLLSIAAQATTQQIQYRFEPTLSNGHRSFLITVTFRTQAPVTKIVIPSTWGGASHLETDIQHLNSQTTSALLMDGNSAGEKLVKTRRGTQVRLSYDLVSSAPGPFRHPAEHRAVLAPEYFLFNPENSLIHPNFKDREIVKAVFDWRPLPPDMPFFSSFGGTNPLLKIRAPWFKISDAIFAGGDFRVLKSTQGAFTVELAVRGNWSFSDAEAFSEIRKIINEENAFWRANPLPYYLVTLAPFDQDSGSSDGSAFTNAFMLFLSRKDTFTPGKRIQIAHEVFHNWNPHSMGPHEDSVQWFTEGFTTYYADVLLLRSGLISYTDYLGSLNEHLHEYEMSPRRNLSNSEWLKVDHTRWSGSRLPYARGTAIALWADAQIREHTKGRASLDNVMSDLVSSALHKSNPPALTEERIIAAFRPYLSTADIERLHTYAIDGVTVPIPSKLGACASQKVISLQYYDWGFDEETLKGARQFVGITQNGPAYRAGLRNGQRYSSYDIHDTQGTFLIQTDTGKQEIRYSFDAEPRLVPQYEASSDAAKPQACTPF